jgi:mRNA interferase MazF
VPLTSNVVWAGSPGNTFLSAKVVGLPKDSVANASLIFTTNREFLTERISRLPPKQFAQVMQAIDVVLGR